MHICYKGVLFNHKSTTLTRSSSKNTGFGLAFLKLFSCVDAAASGTKTRKKKKKTTDHKSSLFLLFYIYIRFNTILFRGGRDSAITGQKAKNRKEKGKKRLKIKQGTAHSTKNRPSQMSENGSRKYYFFIYVIFPVPFLAYRPFL